MSSLWKKHARQCARLNMRDGRKISIWTPQSSRGFAVWKSCAWHLSAVNLHLANALGVSREKRNRRGGRKTSSPFFFVLVWVACVVLEQLSRQRFSLHMILRFNTHFRSHDIVKTSTRTWNRSSVRKGTQWELRISDCQRVGIPTGACEWMVSPSASQVSRWLRMGSLSSVITPHSHSVRQRCTQSQPSLASVTTASADTQPSITRVSPL